MLWEEGTPGSLLSLIASGFDLPNTFIVLGRISTGRMNGGASGAFETFKGVTISPLPILALACKSKLFSSGKRGGSLGVTRIMYIYCKKIYFN
jgi:hypothetical protein